MYCTLRFETHCLKGFKFGYLWSTMAASQDLRRILLKIIDGMAFRCFMGAKHRTRKHHASLVSPVPEQPTEIERTLVHVVKSSSTQSYRTMSRQESAGSGSPVSFNSRRSSGHQSKSSVMLSRSSSSEPSASEIERAGALLADAMTKRKMCYSQTPKSSASSLSALSPVSPWAREIRSAEDLVSAARNRLHVLQREQELFNKPRIQPSTVKDERRSMELRRASAIGNHDENVVQRSTCRSSGFLSRSPPVAPLHKSFTGAVFSYAPNEFDLCRKRTGMIAYSP